MNLDLDPQSRTYKILDWIDTTARSIPVYTRILMLAVILFGAVVFAMFEAEFIPYLVKSM